MTITLFPPVACSEQGQRAHNQDSIFPKQANSTDKLFLVCDGVGGMSQGSDASRIVCESFGSALSDKPISDQKIIDEALLKAEFALNEFAKTQVLPKGMATTLTLLHFHAQGATIAHIGDSRVYQIREGKVVFKTHDHSWVNELVRQGVISPEQARTHPQRNVIARAIQADKPAQAEVHLRTDLQPNDYFLLVSDGILESCAEESLLLLMQQDRPNSEKMDMIQNRCRLHSRDNFSCYLVQIQSVTQEPLTVLKVASSVEQEKPTILKSAERLEQDKPTVLKSAERLEQDKPTVLKPVKPDEQDASTQLARIQSVTSETPSPKVRMESSGQTDVATSPVPLRVESSNPSSTATSHPTETPPNRLQTLVLWILFISLLSIAVLFWWITQNN